MMKLIVGLGNPGAQYAATRHNMGFDVVDQLLSRQAKRGWEHDRRRALECAWVEYDGKRCALLKPLSYMNRSGRAVAEQCELQKLTPQEVCVVLDDISLPLGSLRLRAKGSCGGHNGLASVLSYLGTQEVPRLRVGVGAPPPGVSMVDHVLGLFTDTEAPLAAEAVLQGAEALLLCLSAPTMELAIQRVNAAASQR